MKPGTVVELPDGRRGTVVYHGLDGYGIMWGEIEVDAEKILSGNPLMDDGSPPNAEWEPEAMLREPYPSADVECVGSDYVRVGPDDEVRFDSTRLRDRIAKLEAALREIAWASPWTAPSLEEAKSSQEIARAALDAEKVGGEG